MVYTIRFKNELGTIMRVKAYSVDSVHNKIYEFEHQGWRTIQVLESGRAQVVRDVSGIFGVEKVEE